MTLGELVILSLVLAGVVVGLGSLAIAVEADARRWWRQWRHR